MKKFYALLLLIIFINAAAKAQELSRIWKSIYTDTAASGLQITDAVTDSSGNTYLAGYKTLQGEDYYQTHLYLQKINAAGKGEWIRYFNDALDSIDAARAVALDEAGNIYVAGTRIDTFCNICTYPSKISDIIVIKYDAEGNRLWLNRYHDSVYVLAAATNIAVLSTGAAVVVGSDGNKAIAIKINKNGGTQWIKKFEDAVFNAVCFDQYNHIIIGGASDPDHLYQTQKPMTMQLTMRGDLRWKNVFDEKNKNGRIHFVAVDPQNYIYANGQTDTIAFYNNPKIITIKYSNYYGGQRWFRKEEDQSSTLPHYFGDFKLDDKGNSYIAGFVHLSSIDDNWLVTKYNKKGERQWISYFDDSVHGSDKPIGLAVAKNGYVYVTGYSVGSNSNYAITTIAYNGLGAQLAATTYKVKKGNGFAADIGLDKDDNAYVSGQIGYYNNPNPSSIVIKYKLIFPPLPNKTSIPFAGINDVRLFPNPAKNNLNVVFTAAVTAKNYTVIIHDISGNAIITKQLTAGEKFMNTNIDVSGLKQGIYTANISDGFTSVSKTFIKE